MLNFKFLLFLLFFITCSHTNAQELVDIPNFFPFPSEKEVLVLGETHTSAATVKLLQKVVEDAQLVDVPITIFIEDGTATAFLLDTYLHGGSEELFNGFFFSYFNEWRAFWSNMRNYLKSSDSNFDVKIVGYDHERLQPLISALKFISDAYPNIDKEYLKQVTILGEYQERKSNTAYPKNHEKSLVADTKENLKNILPELESMLSRNEMNFLRRLIKNPVRGFAGDREKQLFKHSIGLLNEYKSTHMIMITGEGHADYSRKNFVFELNKKTGFNIINVLIVLDNSKYWPNNYKKVKTKELEKPWSKYPMFTNLKEGLTCIDIRNHEKLSSKADYAIIANRQEALTIKGK